MSDLYSPYEANIWNYLMSAFGNEYAVAGIMGWCVGESSLYPTRCEGDFHKVNNEYPTSNTITARIDSYKNQSYELGVRSFAGCLPDGTSMPLSDPPYYGTWYVNDNRYGPGYGLAQWTGVGRKKPMFEYWYNNYPLHSISSSEFQCKWLVHEMRSSFGTCYRAMLNATSVQQAMYDYGYWYETGGSASWTTQIVAQRISYGNALYNQYAGTTPGGNPDPPIDPDPTPPDPPTVTSKIPVWVLRRAQENQAQTINGRLNTYGTELRRHTRQL